MFPPTVCRFQTLKLARYSSTLWRRNVPARHSAGGENSWSSVIPQVAASSRPSSVTVMLGQPICERSRSRRRCGIGV